MRTLGTTAALLSIAVLSACGSPSRPAQGDDDDDDNVDGGIHHPDGNTIVDGGSDDGCSSAAQFVYVVDQDYDLSKFDPTTKTFTTIGSLLDICPDGGFGTPFSMGVDRDANAYVLFSDSTLFEVTGLKTGGPLTCTATPFEPSGDLSQFGMGFSTTQAGGTTDQLFIAGGGTLGDSSSPSTLANLDVGSFQTTTIGQVNGWPELTGTSAAELWGFFPDATHPRIDNIDKTTGHALATYSLSALRGTPTSWAFAAYGGDLWVFLAKDSDTATTVYQIAGPTDAVPGSIKSQTPTGSRTIVGAGVSTCAPIVIGVAQ